MNTFEKIFFWAGIIETTALAFIIFGAWALNKEEQIRIKQEEPYGGKKVDDPWPEWKESLSRSEKDVDKK